MKKYIYIFSSLFFLLLSPVVFGQSLLNKPSDKGLLSDFKEVSKLFDKPNNSNPQMLASNTNVIPTDYPWFSIESSSLSFLSQTIVDNNDGTYFIPDVTGGFYSLYDFGLQGVTIGFDEGTQGYIIVENHGSSIFESTSPIYFDEASQSLIIEWHDLTFDLPSSTSFNTRSETVEFFGNTEVRHLRGTISGEFYLDEKFNWLIDNEVIVAPGANFYAYQDAHLFGTKTESTLGELSVWPGARVYASGYGNPVVFTSIHSLSNSAQPGDWGGVKIYGNAATSFSEGNNKDLSGYISNLRIEYAGVNDVSGFNQAALTLQGVGAASEFYNIQTYRSAGDGIFIDGGTVSLYYLVSTGSGLNGVTINNGWTGNGQYWAIHQNTQSNSAGLNLVGAEDLINATHVSNPVLSNISILHDFPSPEFGAGISLSQGTQGTILNAIVQGFSVGVIAGDDADTQNNLSNESLRFSYSALFANNKAFVNANVFGSDESISIKGYKFLTSVTGALYEGAYDIQSNYPGFGYGTYVGAITSDYLWQDGWTRALNGTISGLDYCSGAGRASFGINSAERPPMSFAYEVEQSGQLKISSVGFTNADTRLSVYRDCNGILIGFNDDAEGSVQSTVFVNDLIKGETIYLVWDDQKSSEGFNFEISYPEFELVKPEANSVLHILYDQTYDEYVSLSFLRNAPLPGNVNYELVFSYKPGSEFIIGSFPADTEKPMASLRISDIDNMLEEADYQNGITTEIYWSIRASNGETTVYANEFRPLTVIRSGVSNALCANPLQAVEGVNSHANGPAWYSFTMPSSDTLLITSIGQTTVSTYLEVYFDCNSLPFVGNGYIRGVNQSESVITGLQEGQTVYILWDDTYSAQGFNWKLQVGGDVKESQTISLVNLVKDRTYSPSDTLVDITAIASSGLPVSYELIVGNGSVVQIAGKTYFDIDHAGQVTISLQQQGNDEYNPAEELTITFNVFKANQNLAFSGFEDKLITDTSFVVSAISDAGIPLTMQVVVGPATIEGDIITLTGSAGTVIVTAQNEGNDNYYPISYTMAFNVLDVTKQNQTISFASISPKVYGDAPFALEATSNKGLPITFDVVMGPATVAGNLLTITGAGIIIVQASQAGNDTINAATTFSQTLVVSKANQSISFETISDKYVLDPAFNISATSSVGLTISYQVQGPAILNGNIVTLTGSPGTVSIKAFNNGNENYNAAELTRTFNVIFTNKQPQTIVFSSIPNKVYGNQDFDVLAGSTSNLDVALTVTSGQSLISINGSTVSILGAGNVSITASQAGNDTVAAAIPVIRTFTISKANQTIDFANISTKTFSQGGSFDAVVTGGGSTSPVVLTANTNNISISGNTVNILGAGPAEITASQAGDANYNSATSVTKLFVIERAQQVITFSEITNKTYGDPDFNLTVTGGASNNPVVLTVENGANNVNITGNAVSIIGVGDVTIKASQAENENYQAAASVSRSFNIAKANQIITIEPISDKVEGGEAFQITASNSSENELTFTVVTGANLATLSGNELTMIGAGNVTVKASNPGNAFYNSAEAVASFCINPAKPIITSEGSLLTSSATTGNQWFRNGTAIAEADGQTFEITRAGEYTVQVTAGTCVGEVSDEFSFVVLGENQVSKDIKMYPNPTSGLMKLNFGASEFRKISIIDIQGSLIAEQLIDKNISELELDLVGLKPGMYSVILSGDQQVIRKQVMKQ